MSCGVSAVGGAHGGAVAGRRAVTLLGNRAAGRRAVALLANRAVGRRAVALLGNHRVAPDKTGRFSLQKWLF